MPPRSSLDLPLHGLPDVFRRAFRDDEVAARFLLVRSDDLPDWADGVDDCRASRIAHEWREQLQRSATVRILGQREYVRFLRLEACRRRLKDLDRTLIEKRDTRRGFAVRSRKDEMDSLPDGFQWLKIGAALSAGHRVRDIHHALRRLAERDGCEHLVFQGVDHSGGVGILDADI